MAKLIFIGPIPLFVYNPSMKKVTTIIINIIIFLSFSALVNAADLPTVQTPSQLLTAEIQKIITAGPLRTSYMYGPDFRYYLNFFHDEANAEITVQEFDDYFHNPADTLYVLSLAYPFLDTTQKNQLATYLQTEYDTMKPYKNDHRGTAGAYREYNDVPQEVRANYQTLYEIASATPVNLSDFVGWTFNPFNFYALYKYAQIAPNPQTKASTILTDLAANGHTNPGALPTDAILQPRPHVLNSYIAGYYGYQGLRQLAGQAADSTNTSRLNSALQKKVAWLPTTNNALYAMSSYEAGGFLWLVPELGEYLRLNALPTINTIVKNQEKMTPYWMIPNVDEGHRLENDFYNEGTLSPLYDTSSLFLAKAYIQKNTREELQQYLHGSGMYRGDLFYIQNLVATLQATTTSPPTPTPVPGDLNQDSRVDYRDLMMGLSQFGQGGVNLFTLNTVLKNFGR